MQQNEPIICEHSGIVYLKGTRYYPASILGGLPVMITLQGSGEYIEVSNIYWMKSNGLPGKEVSEKVYEKYAKYGDPSTPVEHALDAWSYSEHCKKHPPKEPEGDDHWI